jgi:RNase H-fold protein (predicted Holliday junction resolvase)
MPQFIPLGLGLPFPYPSLPFVLARRKKEPSDVEFTINMKDDTNSKLTADNILYMQKNISSLEDIFKTMIDVFCNLKKNNTNTQQIITKIKDELKNNNLFNNLIVGDPKIIPKLNAFTNSKLQNFITKLSNRSNITNLCKLTRTVNVLVGGGNKMNDIEINLKKILSDKYDVNTVNKDSKFYYYNVDWVNSRKEFQNLVYDLLNPKNNDIFFDLMSESMNLLDSVVLDNKKYCVYKHLYNLYQDKKMKNLI